jgi:hypothetical protein
MKLKLRQIILTLGLGASLIIYQNCSEVGIYPLETKKSEKLDSSEEAGSLQLKSAAHSASCDSAVENIKDVFVNVTGAYVGQTKVVAALGMRSLDELAKGFNIILDNPAKSNQIRLILSDKNNHAIDSAGNRYEIKVPSGEPSGLKILLPKQKNFSGNTAYTVIFALDLDTQIVRSPNECLLKPMLHAMEIGELEF